jgi:hypothetical protein
VSVELIPPEEQYEHNPMVLLPYPQFSGSFVMPVMQLPLDNEFAGSAQLVKSARIVVRASLLAFEHRALSCTTYDSLSAN